MSLLISSPPSLGRQAYLVSNTGEPHRSLPCFVTAKVNLTGVPTQEGGSLRNHTIPNLGVSNPSERFLTDLVLAHGVMEVFTDRNLVVRSQGTGS